MTETTDEKIRDLCILGRDRLYITLMQYEKTIEFVVDNGCDDLRTLLYIKKEEVEKKIKESSEIINSL